MFAFNGLHVQRQGKSVDPLSIALPRSNLESVCAKRTRLIAFVTATIIAAIVSSAIATIITASVVIATTIVITHVLTFVVVRGILHTIVVSFRSEERRVGKECRS